MLQSVLLPVAKSALVVAGSAFGLVEALVVFGSSPEAVAPGAQIEKGLDSLRTKLVRAENAIDLIELRVAEMVTRTELDARLGAQAESMESLRIMITHTDELLERVLERLESDAAEYF